MYNVNYQVTPHLFYFSQKKKKKIEKKSVTKTVKKMCLWLLGQLLSALTQWKWIIMKNQACFLRLNDKILRNTTELNYSNLKFKSWNNYCSVNDK